MNHDLERFFEELEGTDFLPEFDLFLSIKDILSKLKNWLLVGGAYAREQ